MLIAGGLVATLAIGAGGFILGRATGERETEAPAPPPVVAAEPVQPVRIEPPVPALDRAGIIALAAAAADATASGEPLPKEVTDAQSRRFSLYLPFGCGGPAGEASRASLRWTYDEDNTALRIRVAPTSLEPGTWLTAAAAPGVEAIQGFWIERPWSSSTTCPPGAVPAAPAGTEPVTLPGQTLAIAEFFPPGDTRRTLDEAKPFETVVRISPDELPTDKGFRVKLTGRIDRVPGNGPVHCVQPGGTEQRPICMVAASFDEIAIENAETGKVLGTWTIRRGSRVDR